MCGLILCLILRSIVEEFYFLGNIHSRRIRSDKKIFYIDFKVWVISIMANGWQRCFFYFILFFSIFSTIKIEFFIFKKIMKSVLLKFKQKIKNNEMLKSLVYLKSKHVEQLKKIVFSKSFVFIIRCLALILCCFSSVCRIFVILL